MGLGSASQACARRERTATGLRSKQRHRIDRQLQMPREPGLLGPQTAAPLPRTHRASCFTFSRSCARCRPPLEPAPSQLNALMLSHSYIHHKQPHSGRCLTVGAHVSRHFVARVTPTSTGGAPRPHPPSRLLLPSRHDRVQHAVIRTSHIRTLGGAPAHFTSRSANTP